MELGGPSRVRGAGFVTHSAPHGAATNIANTFTPTQTVVTQNPIPRTVVGYARVSTDLQREKEIILTQIECIETECRSRGWRLGEVYCDDGVSGTLPLEARPAGARLLADARSGKVGALVVYKADRMGRDVLVNEMAARLLHDELGVQVYGVAESIELRAQNPALGQSGGRGTRQSERAGRGRAGRRRKRGRFHRY